jgi:hypothetical protein
MCLAVFVRNDEDALICDFAETYHVYDWRSLPVHYSAVLAAGLRQNSRSQMKLANVKADLNASLLAVLHDDMKDLIYATIAPHMKRKPKQPEHTADKIIHGEQKQAKEYQGYESSEDYEEAWARIAGHAHVETR